MGERVVVVKQSHLAADRKEDGFRYLFPLSRSGGIVVIVVIIRLLEPEMHDLLLKWVILDAQL